MLGVLGVAEPREMTGRDLRSGNRSVETVNERTAQSDSRVEPREIANQLPAAAFGAV